MLKEGEPIRPFQGLAEIYNKEPYRSIGTRRARFIQRVFREFNFSPDSILDLGCGSGTGSRIFSEAGCCVVGVDVSRAMLKINRKKAQEKSDLRLVQADMRNLPFTDCAFNGVISVFDALNYLTLRELSGLFIGVKRVLKNGGLIAFDFLTRRAFDDVDSCPNSAYEGEGFYHMSKAETTSPGVVNLELTAFIEQKSTLYRRVQEMHTLNLFDIEEVADCLKDGFQVEKVYDGEEFKEADANSWHAIILARSN